MSSCDEQEEWDSDALLEQVRQQAHQLPSWDELVNDAKTILLEKRNVLDNESREKLRQAVAILQENKMVNSQKELFAVLKEISAKAELKFAKTSENNAFILSDDSFYVEIQCVPNSDNTSERFAINKVLLVHPNQDTEPCADLQRTIERCDWGQLERQLRNMINLYPSKGSSSVMSDTFVSMCSVEKDIVELGRSASWDGSDIVSSVNQSRIGFVSSRREGNPCRVLFFLKPYDLIHSGRKLDISSETDLLSKNIGVYFDLTSTTCSVETPLPTTSQLNDDGSFRKIDGTNGKVLPCCLQLKLNRKLLLTAEAASRIKDITGLELMADESGNFFQLFRKLNSDSVRNNVEFHVTLPGDERHAYILDDQWGRRWEKAVVVDRLLIATTEHLAALVPIVRAQLLFVTLLESCVRRQSAAVGDRKAAARTVELRCPSTAKVQLVFQRRLAAPATDSDMLTVDVDMVNGPSDMKVALASFKGLDVNQPNVLPRLLTVLKLTWSIPIVVRELGKLLDNMPAYHLSSPDKRDGGRDSEDEDDHAKKPKYDLVENRDRESTTETTKDASFWLSSYPRGGTSHKNSKVVGSAWLPYFHKEPMHKAPPVLTYRFVSLANKKSNNLLDLFKEIDVCKELIPPLPNQPSLKSPTPLAPPVPFSHSFPAPTSRLQEMLSRASDYPQGGLLNPAHTPGAVARTERHYSVGAGESILGELDTIAKLSNSLTSQQSVGGGEHSSTVSTPTEERFGPAGEVYDMQRRCSIQDSIESVARGSPQDVSLSSASPLSPFLQQSFPPSPAGNRAPVPMRFPHPHNVGPPRSFDFDYSRQRGADVFDFEKSEEGVFPATSLPTPTAAASAAPFFRPDVSPFPFPGNAAPHSAPFFAAAAASSVIPPTPTGKGVRGSCRGRGTRGGRGRGSARQLSADGTPIPKEPKKRGASTALRKPRKPRGAVNTGVMPTITQVSTSDLLLGPSKPPAIHHPLVSTMMPPFSVYDKTQILASPSITTEEKPSLLTPVAPAKLLPRLEREQSSQFGLPAVVVDPLKQSPVDNGSPDQPTSGEDNLSAAIRDVLKSDALSKVDECPNIFENIGAVDTKLLSDISSTSKVAGETKSAGQAGAVSRAKPNILVKVPNRKGSLDLVIGKLKEQATSRVSASDLYDDEMQADDGSTDGDDKKAAAPGPESVFEEETNSRSPLAAGGSETADALKVVIRRTQLQPSPTGGKSSLSRQKSDASDGSTQPSKSSAGAEGKTTKQKSADRIDPKTGLVKPKPAARKRKQPDERGKTSTKLPKHTKQMPAFPGGSQLAPSLKNFRIPRVVEEKPPAPQAASSLAHTLASPPAFGKAEHAPFFGAVNLSSSVTGRPLPMNKAGGSVMTATTTAPPSLHKTKLTTQPRSILKNAPSAQPQQLQPPPPGRKALLPNPFEPPSQAPPVLHQIVAPPIRAAASYILPAAVAPPAISRGAASPSSHRMDWSSSSAADGGAGAGSGGAPPAEISSPDALPPSTAQADNDDDDTVQSPDQQQPLLVDESVDSSSDGLQLDTSKEIDPLSPQLKIDDSG